MHSFSFGVDRMAPIARLVILSGVIVFGITARRLLSLASKNALTVPFPAVFAGSFARFFKSASSSSMINSSLEVNSSYCQGLSATRLCPSTSPVAEAESGTLNAPLLRLGYLMICTWKRKEVSSI